MKNSIQDIQEGHFVVDEGYDIRELFSLFWRKRLVIVVSTALSAVLSVLFALSLPNIYTSEALLASADEASGGLGSLAKQYGSLARLAGVSLPGGGDSSNVGLAIEMLKSRAFLASFIERRGIMADLMAVESWDFHTGALTYNPELYDRDSETWVREVPPPMSAKPSSLEAYKAFLQVVEVNENAKTGFITVSVEHLSPVVAQSWVQWLVEDINDAVREQDVSEARKSIEFLQNQIEKTSLAELQTMFFELIQTQIETIMLAEARPEYVFKVIDPAVVPEEKSSPRRAMICIMGTFLGGILSLFFVAVRHMGRRA